MAKIKSYNFCHVHLHTDGSLFDGVSRPIEIIKAAKKLGQEHLAISDHGTMVNCMEFYLKCKELNINPLIGIEAYIDNDREKHREEKIRDRGHLILIAKNRIGYKNLCRITSEAHEKGFYYKPLATYDVIKEFSEGIICTTACGLSPVAQKIIDGKGALEEVKILRKIFGDDLYLEIQFNEWDKQHLIDETLVKYSRKLDIPLVVGVDVHYIEKIHHKVQDALLCINQRTTLTDPKRFCINSKELYLKNAHEVFETASRLNYKIKESYLMDAMKNTVKLAERCKLELKLGKPKIPSFTAIEKIKISADELLEQKCRQGLKERIKNEFVEKKDKKKWQKQIKHELFVIKKLGFADYLLIIADIIKIAKKLKAFIGPGRGSSAGSRVCFCLGITNINPEEHGLIFERFLNLHRKEMPDIDIDFDSETRGKIIDEVKKKYGEKKVRQIISVDRFHVAGLVRDLKKVLEYNHKTLDRLSWFARDTTKTWKQHREELEERKQPGTGDINYFIKTKDGKRFLWYLEALENQIRHLTRHPAGYVIAPKRVDNYVPLQRVGGKDGELCVSYTEGTGKSRYISKVGLLKVDFLGLITCSIIRNTLSLIKKYHRKDYTDTIWKVNPKDKKILKEFCDGNTMMIFQFESESITKYVIDMKPDSISDIAIANACHRPAVLESGQATKVIESKKSGKISTGDKELDKILGPTYGSIVFEEQFLQIFHKLAGFDLDETDSVRREVKKPSKTRIDLVEKELNAIEKRFVKGCLKNKNCSLKKKSIKSLWEIMKSQAVYQFNKSHSMAYALIAWQTMWLKTRYPKEFVCAVLNARDNKTVKNKYGDKTVPYLKFLGEGRRLEIKLFDPDVNKCGADFKPMKKGISFGLACIKHISDRTAKAIEEAGPFKSVKDFYNRAKDNNRKINKRAIENLINVNGFSEFGSKKKVRKLFNKYRGKKDIENPDDEWQASNDAFGFIFYHPFLSKIPKGDITWSIDLRKKGGERNRVCVAGYVINVEKRYGKFEIMCQDQYGYFTLVVDPKRCPIDADYLNKCVNGKLIKAVGVLYKKIYLEEIVSLKKDYKKFFKKFVQQ